MACSDPATAFVAPTILTGEQRKIASAAAVAYVRGSISFAEMTDLLEQAMAGPKPTQLNSSELNEMPIEALCELAWSESTRLGPCNAALLLDALGHRLYVNEEFTL